MMKNLLYCVSVVVLLVLLGACDSTVSLQGDYGGKSCLGKRLSLRKDGQIFLTDKQGREMPGTYKVDGDKIAIAITGDRGPGIVMTREGSAFTFVLPQVLGNSADKMKCQKLVQAGALSEKDAEALLRASFVPTHKLRVGKFEVYPDGLNRPDTSSGFQKISPQVEERLRYFEKAGIVRISGIKSQYCKDSWNRFNCARMHEIEVLPTETGQPFVSNGDANLLEIPVGELRNLKIDKIEPIRRAGDDFSRVDYTVDRAFTPAWLAYLRQLPPGAPPAVQTVRTLFKWDGAEQQWERLASDVADAAGAFKTNHVGKVLDAAP